MAESVTRFLGEDASLGSTIQNLEGRLDGFGQSVDGVGQQTSMLPAAFSKAAVAIAAFVASVAGAAIGIKTFSTALEFIDKLDNLKAATGASGEELIKLQRVFELTGSSADKVGPALNKVQEMIAKAADNSPKAVEKLSILGVTLDELRNLSPAEQMERVMKAIDALPTPAEKARAAMAVFGTQLGRELMPLIKDFDGEMGKALETLGSFPRVVETYGPSMSRFGDAIDALKKKPEEFAVGVVGPMSTILGNLAQRFATFDASGLGEAIGIELQKALFNLLAWAENVKNFLGGIWEGLGGASIVPYLRSAADQILTLYHWAKSLFGNVYEGLRDANFSEIGFRLGEAIRTGLQPLRDFNESPSAAMGNFWAEMDRRTMSFGALLTKTIVTSLESGVAQSQAFEKALNSEQVQNIGSRIANGIYFAILNFPKWNEAMSSPVNAFKMVWGASQESNATVLKNALINAFQLANSRFLDLFTNPAKLAAGLFGTALRDAFLNFIKVFTDTWTSTNGSIIEKFRAAYNAVLDSTGKTMVGASETAANNTKQAGDNLAKGATDLVAGSAQARDNISAAKAEVTGPGGISPALDANASALNQTANKTQAASRETVNAFSQVVTSGKDFKTSADTAGKSFANQTAAAGRALEAGVKNAMKSLTDSVRGFATEATLKRAVASLERLERKLPQPVLV